MIEHRKAVPAALAWWRAMQPDPETRRPGDRAALARLRRCTSVAEAMQDPASIALFRRAGSSNPDDLPTIALAASVLAQVRKNAPGVPVARQIGPDDPDHPETARMSPLRFRRLLETATPDERLIAFRRLVAFAEGTLDLRDLAAALLGWTEERRRRWVYDYWDAGRPAADTTTPAEDTAP